MISGTAFLPLVPHPGAGLLGHELDRLLGDRLVVGDDDDALAEIGRGPVEDGDRHVAVLGFLDDGDGALAVLRDQDDAVDALGDAVAHLFELPVGVLGGVALDHLMAGLVQGLDHGGVARPPRTPVSRSWKAKQIVPACAPPVKPCGERESAPPSMFLRTEFSL
jgi:hypothetical protein